MHTAVGGSEIAIRDLSLQGEGIGRLEDGTVVFVPGALPGERVRVRLQRRQRQHWRADLVAVVEPAPERRRPPCILSRDCGGCTLQPLDDAAQAQWKQEQVQQSLRRIAQLPGKVLPILAAPQPLGYRNRAVIPLERTVEGVLRAGYYRRGSHRIVNLSRCPVLDPRIDQLIAPLKSDLEASGWPVDRHGGGGLRHLALRVGQASGEVLITLITRAISDLPGAEALAGDWMERWPQVVGVTVNDQPDPGNRLFGDRNHVLAGRAWLKEGFAGLELRIPADAFFQVNTRQAEALVPLMREALGEPNGLLIDAYCGIGTFSLPLAAAGWRVVGIEQHPGAVSLAAANAERLGLAGRARFEVADVARELPQHLGSGEVGALLLDPPRKGLSSEVLAAIVAAAPERLLYLSCDPATLCRDLGQLCGEGPFTLLSLQPVDFFPNTSHIECLAVLARRSQQPL